MVHRSENSAPLKIHRNAIHDWVHLQHQPTNSSDVFFIHLPTEQTYIISHFKENIEKLNAFLNKLHKRSVFCILASSETALTIIPMIQKYLYFKLWISVKREKIISIRNELPNNHASLLIFTKFKDSLKHCKTQISYTYCPACKKTTKDYGGKKHLYSPYGTLISDVWRDIVYKSQGTPESILSRLSDVFGITPYRNLFYFDFRNLTSLMPHKKMHKVTIKDKKINLCGESQLINADCLDALRTIPKNSIDFAFADPPYNIKKKYENWNDGLDIKKYFEWCDRWLNEMTRILKPGRTVAVINIPLWVVRHYAFMQNILNFQTWITWEGLGLPVRKIMPAHYGIICMAKGNSRGTVGFTGEINSFTKHYQLNSLKEWYCTRQSCVRQRNKISDRESLTDLWWDIHRIKHNSRRVDHPCQLPPRLMRRLISLYTHKGETVLDPFNGAGTTTLVAHELERKYIGIELSKQYHQLALERHRDLDIGIDPFAKGKTDPTAKNSRVKRIKKQNYVIPKKTLQLEVKKIAENIGRKPSREDIKKYSSYPIEYFDEYFIDWGEVCSAVGDKGMNENLYEETSSSHHMQLKLLEKSKKYVKSA